MVNEFKEFIARGNVMDMAVGVIMGSAFGKIVTSLVDNILMPIIGMILGNIDFTTLTIKVTIWDRTTAIKYGIFIQNVVDFLIVALCIFLMIKALNKLAKKIKKPEEEKEEEPKKSDETLLLEEIRDLLKKQSKEK